MSAAPKLSYQVAENSDYISVSLSQFPDAESAKAFEATIDEAVEKEPKNVVIMSERVGSFSVAWVRTLMRVSRSLKKHDKQIRLVGLSESMLRFIKQEGVENSLKPIATLKDALVDLGLRKERTLDVNFINPFLNATIKVLGTQCQIEAKAGPVYKKGPRDRFMGDISGVIGLVSEVFSGSVVISFPKQTFLKVMSNMIGEECTEITKDIEDGAGEITNIIFGQAKIELNEHGFGIKTALPSVVAGNDHSILQMSTGPRVVIPFQTPVGQFFVEICTSS